MINTFKWIKKTEITTLIKILQKIPKHSFRFVGGCVRDSLLGLEPKDFDIASNISPEKNIQNLNKYNIKNITTNKNYGTIIAIINNEKFEITSLRKDIQTFGRRAKVEFTNDFLEDAKRRDFTINALYYSPSDNKIYDYFSGIDDISYGKIKFIGNIKDRINEDHLRILRFIRFHTTIGKIDPTIEEIKIIKPLSILLKKLSKERITSELNKILNSEHITKGISLINKLNITPTLFDQTTFNVSYLNNFIKLEKEYYETPNYLLRLLSMLTNINKIKNLYPQKKIHRYINNLNKLTLLMKDESQSPNDILSLYSYSIVKDFCILKLSKKENVTYYTKLLNLSIEAKDFKIPINGNDVLALGLKDTTKIGNILNILKSWGLLNQNASKIEYIELLKKIMKKIEN